MRDHNGMGNGPIHEAAEKGDLTGMLRLLKKDPRLVEANGWFGVKPLHYAAQSGSVACVQALLDRGADVNARCVENRSTAIFEASTAEVARLLLAAGAELDVVTTKGRVPLDYACQGAHVDVVRVLVEQGVDVNYAPPTNHYHTMLQWAFAESGTKWFKAEHLARAEQIIDILLEAGADPSAKNVYGSTALHLACQHGLVNIVRKLLAYGADPNIRDLSRRTAFHYSATKPEMLTLLEPLRRDEPEPPRPEQTPEQLVGRLLAIGMATQRDFRPCSNKDIAYLEEWYGVTLPTAYKKFLCLMGRGAGDFLVSDHWYAFYDDLVKGLGGDRELLPQDSFVFATRQHDVYLSFVADGTNDDPPVFASEWGDAPRRVYKSFWDFFEEMVEYYEFYLDKTKFS